ncbi:hypothetical protein F5Y14DRAFT_133836 [Nemania sp. NC0429]|nr:hypothetical protein F5Y14DRAFT_133836 [Nemania sp. NC0429]
MASWAIKEKFHRVATQPGSAAKKWDRDELIRCRATGTEIATGANLRGRPHPVFANWFHVKPELQEELWQPILLASRILAAVGLPWLSDFLIDDIFHENYPGRERDASPGPTFAHEEGTTPRSIVRHHRDPLVPRAKQRKWIRSARDVVRKELPKLVQWQIDDDMFQQRGWNGYTCRHPKGGLPLGELDQHDTIKEFDSLSLHEDSRNLTILVTAEYPARLAELRRQGKARGEEYLITAFMMTVTILHELGHAIYWKDRRSLTRDLREPFYGADMEMELGDSFVAALFGGWIPVPVRELSRLREDFSFADGVAWRQALSWDHHRVRPKYRAHYSIPVDYIARLFTEESWSTTPDGIAALIRPQSLTGESAALRTVGLCTPLTQQANNEHATAAIADFHCTGDGWVWNRRPGARFRIPQYDGRVYPELELPTAREDAIREPRARKYREKKKATTRDSVALHLSSATATAKAAAAAERKEMERESWTSEGPIADARVVTMTRTGVRVIEGDASPLPLPLPSPSPSPAVPKVRVVGRAGVMAVKLSPRKSEYSPRKFAVTSHTLKISRPPPGRPPVPEYHGVEISSKQRQRERAKISPPSQDRASEGREQQCHHHHLHHHHHHQHQHPHNHQGVKRVGQSQPPQATTRHDGENQETGDEDEDEDENTPWPRFPSRRGDSRNNNSHTNGVKGRERDEISVDELKKRLSQLIGVSLTELEKLFDGSQP